MSGAGPATLAHALRLARRELRGGLRGFAVFLACLALGVGAIAAVGTLSAAVKAGLAGEGRNLLGGDVRIHLAQRPAEPAALDWIAREGGVIARVVEMRVMAFAAAGAGGAEGAARTLVEMKAVDSAYPLYGAVELDGGGALADALALRDGRFGAAVDSGVLGRLGLAPGGRLRIGEAEFEVRALIAREPDRIAGRFILGPRVLVSPEGLAASGLARPGSLIRYDYLIRLPAEVDAGRWVERLDAAFPGAGWRVQDFRHAAPGVVRFVDRTTLFLTLVGLTALLVGGIGVANAVHSFLDGRTATIATLKCLGAPARVVFATYLVQVLGLALIGIAAGLIVGTAAPLLGAPALAGLIPVPLRPGLYPAPLAEAAGLGILTAVAFSLWPLGRAGRVPAASLFRSAVAPSGPGPGLAVAAATAAAVGLLAVLTVASAADRIFALWFVVGAGVSFAALRAAGLGLARLARALRVRHPALRLGLANLHRPGAAMPSVVLSLGLGLSVLVTVVLIEANLARELEEELPERAPAFFFIDIQPDQMDGFLAAVRGVSGAGAVRSVPALRGRVVEVNGTPAEALSVPPHVAWALQGDRGLTYAARPPEGARLVAGRWWPADYAGPALVSMDAEIARGFGVGLGDTITFNVLGREIRATIANLREIEWRSFGLNFVFVLSPGTLAGAPQTHIATVEAGPAAEAALLRAVTDRFANVTAIPVREAIRTVGDILASLSAAVRATAALTLVAGALVLAGAIASGQHRRIYDAVVLKVVGATRGDVLAAFLVEYALLGTASAAVAAAVGSLAAYAVVTFVMETRFALAPGAVAAALPLALALTLAAGFAGTWRALGRKAAPLLRND
ncbi:MAG: FtsX-like permease family protein [Proteobacteria bacterium]|nr:FtsX-like permease family protein [Pseudomonadota bacterium]